MHINAIKLKWRRRKKRKSIEEDSQKMQGEKCMQKSKSTKTLDVIRLVENMFNFGRCIILFTL